MRKKSIVLKIFAMTMGLIFIVMIIQMSFSNVFLTQYYEEARINNIKSEVLKLREKINENSLEDLISNGFNKELTQFEENQNIKLALTNERGIPIYGLDQAFGNIEIQILDDDNKVYIIPIDEYQNKKLLESDELKTGQNLEVSIATMPGQSVASTMIKLDGEIVENSEAKVQYITENIEGFDNADEIIIGESILIPAVESGFIEAEEVFSAMETNVAGKIQLIRIDEISENSSAYGEQIFYDYINNFIESKDNSILSDLNTEINVTTTKDKKTDITNVVMNTLIKDAKGNSYWIFLTVPVQSLQVAAGILSYYSIYIFIIAIVLGGIITYIYSKKLAKPLIELSEKAKAMSEMKFDVKCDIQSNDELGELGNSLNELSKELKFNIGELQRTNACLKDDIERDRKQSEERKTLVATLSHELKTPLMIMRGLTEGIIADIYDRNKLDDVLCEMNAMDDLIKELLAFSKLEVESKKQLENNKKEIEVINICGEVFSRFEYLRQEKDIDLKFNVNDEFSILGSINQIEKILSNIFHNGILYSPNGASINVNVERIANSCGLISIENTGTFIPTDELENIWKPFYRLEKSRNKQTGGNGLGLYLVKELVELNNGSINVSNTNDGVCFELYFDVEKEMY